ncbi:membrane integrity-associated transporter subunit PqiC [Sphingomonas sp. JC676]|uniref:ABC-type transport auxiliary lipoprotein family protein n=1 Tax=Sphingomonas sp. JC676 TaxID=2768065 RepID=UPI001657F560|nr:ABC-type transport auxiliary lipoprotein family protein [Sphingomonas sp. JC676]MBC9033385.1 membrane integrity-associated transporter subunit PqiC [Sphingomonas sp. JC676]
MNTRIMILTVLLAAPLSGCISFGAKPPPSLLTLTSASGLAVGETQKSNAAGTITIGVPAVSQELASNRVPVHSGGTAIAYVKDAQWVEPPSRLFARLLSDTITAQTGRVVLSYRQSRMDPGAQLTGELRAFGIDEETSEAVVTYDAALLRGADPVFEKRRFEARVPVTKIDSEGVGPALNQAANKVAAEIADWVGK